MGTKVNCRLTARLIVSAVTLAFIAGAFSTSAPNAGASWVFSWSTETPMGVAATQAVVVSSTNGTVYIMGGATTISYGAVADSYAYDPYSGDWTVLTSMPGAVRGAAGAMGLDGLVYVFGGNGGSSYTQIYDPELNSWTLGVAMPYAVWEGKAATVTNGSIWVVGGEGSPTPGYAQIYDPVANSWSVGKPAPAGVLCGAMIAVGDDLYYSGGGVGSYSATTNFFMYDASLRNWVSLRDLPEPRAAQAMVLGVDGLIYLVGGSSDGYNVGANAYSTVVAYNPATDEWSQVAEMDYARKYLGATVTPDGRVIALGGNTVSSVLSVVESLQLYVFQYSISLSASSVRAGESVLMTVDAQFTYINELYSQLDWYLVSDADGTIYNPAGLQIPTDSPAAISIDVPELAPPGSYKVVVHNWVIYAEGVYEVVEMQELPLEVLPAPAPVDALIAELEAQVADLQKQIDNMSGDIEVQLAALESALDTIEHMQTTSDQNRTEQIAALQDQIDAMQEQLDKVKTTSDSGSMWGMVNMILVIIVIVLLALMFVMGRKGKTPAPPAT